MARAALARSGANLWTAVKRTLLVGATIALAYLVVRAVLSADDLARAVSTHPPLALACAALIYLAGHGIRILRLALLIGGWRVGFRDIASFHLLTAAVSLAAPLKLGEVYRVVELSNIAGGFLRSLMIAWCERAFDTIVILIMLVIAMSEMNGASADIAGVAAFAALFVAMTAAVFFLAPDNLRRLSVLIIRRYDSPKSVPVLRALDTTRRAILSAPALVRGKVASLSAMTMLIWLCEIVAFALIMPTIGNSLKAGLDGLLSFLSAITTGQTLIDALAASTPLLTYLAATQVPLVALGVIAALHYVPGRLRA
jgi:hypothetical protein